MPKFGPHVRELREKKKISLRRFAEMLKVSPTYLSKIERGTLPPPTEQKIRAVAQKLGGNADELMALAGRVPSDLPRIIRKHPLEMAILLRTADKLSVAELRMLTRNAAEQSGMEEPE